ncbi:deoxyuridine 5'-triphosphate nucleotidohydrolase-like [Nematolebias whitei]|uniref:deoxyuridine 5'-triphosphate nucleotidohydrolase-like n=1 Tax=Nematolebias whitei TaxID=451745 RepID=UPI001898986E|nr:deoxyuridine 5'-triphosphate nucleotidohydrolase-like [Nematolebias whitei]
MYRINNSDPPKRLREAKAIATAMGITIAAAYTTHSRIAITVSERGQKHAGACVMADASVAAQTGRVGAFRVTGSSNASALDDASALSPINAVKMERERDKPVLRFAKISEHAVPPTRGFTRDTGYDLYSAHDCTVGAMDKAVVKTDIQIAVSRGYYGRVALRSGLAAKHFIDVGAGIVDEDYRGNVSIVLFNFGKATFDVKRGDRVAQLVCEKICYPDLVEEQTLAEMNRGARGFGSTGRN